MSTEDRILRLENAMSTLAETAAEQQRRTGRLEESFVLVSQLLNRHEERLDGSDGEIDELKHARAETERKIAALVDAHVGTEELVRRLAETVAAMGEARAEAERRFAELTEVVKEIADSHRELTDSHRELINSHGELTESQRELTESQRELTESQRTLAESHRALAEAQRELAEAQAHSDQRLDALIDIVRKRIEPE